MDSRAIWMTRTLRTALGLAVTALGVWLLFRGAVSTVAALKTQPFDGIVDWTAARCFWAHQDIFDLRVQQQHGLGFLGGFGHPPTTIFWFLPLAAFDLQTMSAIVGLVMVALLLYQVVLIVQELELPEPPAATLLVFGASLASPWMYRHLGNAQISELIAFFYVVAWYFLRRDREIPAGIALGLACTLKFFPAIMILFLLLLRRWRAVLASAAAYLAVALFIATRFGIHSWMEFFVQQRTIADRWIWYSENASIAGIVVRLFWPACKGIGHASTAASAISAGLSAALLALSWRWCRDLARRRETFDLPYAWFSIVSVMVNPWVWQHYRTFLLLPLLVAGVALWRAQPGIGVASRIALALVLCSVVVILQVDFVAELVSRVAAVAANPALHAGLHFYEVVNWLPWVLTLLVLGVLLWNSRAVAPTGSRW
jgi:Glycosyltransferase family 87